MRLQEFALVGLILLFQSAGWMLNKQSHKTGCDADAVQFAWTMSATAVLLLLVVPATFLLTKGKIDRKSVV